MVIRINHHLALCSALCLTVLSLAGCIQTAVAQTDNSQAPAAAPAPAQSTIGDKNGVVPIGPSDPLDITVIGQVDLSKTYVVDADGNITMAYVGKIHVGGFTPDQAATLISVKLSQYYVSPQVTVSRPDLGGISVTVTGAVGKQGTVGVRRDSHLNDVVQQATPTEDADLAHVQVTRGLPGQPHTTLNIDLGSFLVDGTLSNNPPLQDGDSIFVPKKTQNTLSCSVVGSVVHPGRYTIAPGTTAFDLVTQAGGLLSTADPASVYVQPIGVLTEIPFNYTTASTSPQDPAVNPVLKDGDKVVVPEAASVPVYSITGAVLKPGEYPLKGKQSLLDALGIAGGLEPRAKTQLTTVTRETPQGVSVLKVNAGDQAMSGTFFLQPGDNVVIPQGSAPATVSPFEVIGVLIALASLFRN